MQQDAFQLFGPPARVGPADRVPLPAERLFHLVAYLAASGDWLPRDRLAALLYPECDNTAARRNLRKLLFRATPQLPSIEARADAVRLRIDTDVREFEAAIEQRDWARAVELYRGPFADGLEFKAPAPYEAWLRFERDRLAALFRAAAAERLAQLDDANERAQLARRWLALEPLDEDALIALAEATAASGRVGEAQRLASEFAQRLKAELGVEPSARVRDLAQPTRTSRTDAPRLAVRAAATEPGFIGRRAELLELKALLARDECRVLTITGPGGIGKSRLVRVALAQLAPQFEATAWIALEDLADVAQIAPRIAAALGLSLSGANDPLMQVIEHLRARRVLLVADNSEHLTGFAPLCSQFVSACPQLKVLQTSRTRLSIEGEWVLPLAGLPVPDADENETAVVRSFDAVKLFESRALAAAPAFDAAANATEVAALARALDGAPLALELAAPWVRLLPLAEIRREIAGSLDLLVGSEHAPDRHRSVRASFEHSWRLLATFEQQALSRLSIFVGPFTAVGAAQVAQAGLAVLASLVDKSLLRSDGNGRFSFHALMQQCAHERHVDAAQTRRRYIDYHAQLLDRYGDLKQTANKQTIEAIEVALEDLRAAWTAAIDDGDGTAAEAMAAPLFRFFEIKGRWTEGLALFTDAIARLDAERAAQRGALAAASRAIAALYYRKGEPETAETAARRALKLFRSLKRLTGVRQCLQVIGLSLWQRGEIERAKRYFEEGLKLAERAGDELGTAAPLNGIAMCEKTRGRYECALPLYERALALYRRAGAAQGLAITLNNIANVLRMQHDWAGARRYFDEGLALCDKHGLASVRVHFLLNLGHLEIALDRLNPAQSCFELALQTDAAAAEGQASAEIRLGLARISTRRGRFDEARTWLAATVERAVALADVPIQLGAVLYFGEFAARRGDAMQAAELWSFVSAHALTGHGDREEARRFLEALELSATHKSSAARAAGSFVLQDLLAALVAQGTPKQRSLP